MATFRERLNASNANELADLLRAAGLGTFIRSLPAFAYNKAAAVDSYNLAAVTVVKLPDDAKAAQLQRVYIRAGSGGVGEAAVQAVNATPTSGQCAITPSGDIAFVLADAPTSVDAVYTPFRGESVERVLPVSSNAAAIPADLLGRVMYMTEAEVLAGSGTGKRIVEAPSASAASAASARLDLAKANVKTVSGDAATSVRCKFLVRPLPENDLETKLQTASWPF